jgi:predicted dehydrogenase
MHRSTRRTFLMNSAALGVGLASGISARAAAPSERINVAVVGIRGRGNSLLEGFRAQKDVSITWLGDIDEKVLAQRAASLEKSTGQKPRTAKDYRTILEDKDVHVLVLGTPDHWHAIPTIHACQAGKDVYVEKPDGHNILEGKAMVAASRKYERMVQMGTQARSAPFLKEAARFVEGGAIGKVIYGKAWETAKQAPIPRVPDSDPPPGVDYNLWLGPAPQRPFNRYRFHGNWRWFFDTGTGDLGNDGVHRMDYCRWVMGITDFPQAVSASGGKLFFDDAQEWPDTLIVNYEYPGKVLTYEMRIWSEPRLHDHGEGAVIYGDKGWVLVHNSGWKAYDGEGKVLAEGADRLGDGLHIRNFLDAVKSRRREDLNQEIAQGHVSSVMCHAGNIAWRTGKKLRFDAKTETFDDAEANKLLGREYRKGFELPQV